MSMEGNFRAINGAQEVEKVSSKGEENIALVQINNEKLESNGNNANDENNSLKLIQTATEALGEERVYEKKAINSSESSETPSRQEKSHVPKVMSSERKTREEDREELGKECPDERKPPEKFSDGFPFGSPVNDNRDARIDRLVGGDFVDDNEENRDFGSIADSRAIISAKYDDGEVSARDSSEGRKAQGKRDRKSASEGNGSVTCSSSEGEGKPQEPNWEELGLVGQEVLDDLHNKVSALSKRE